MLNFSEVEGSRHERLDVHFSALVTPHLGTFRDVRDVFLLSVASWLPKGVGGIWHWFAPMHLGRSAGHASTLVESNKIFGGLPVFSSTRAPSHHLYWLFLFDKSVNPDSVPRNHICTARIFLDQIHTVEGSLPHLDNFASSSKTNPSGLSRALFV